MRNTVQSTLLDNAIVNLFLIVHNVLECQSRYRVQFTEIEPLYKPDGCQHQSATNCLRDQLLVHEANKTYITIK